ncbi:ABC transporter permease [Colwellia psychrerythraea]|uniref:Permease n=1 Tax=Colwellia psychrerythraea TaxID=28229 RepID=A0A099K9Q0_COLPS|nr:ABC transporter permease [Colwellia psychrerythraea]KGJ86792.1 protein of unknown function DUF214 [Colwellia psychrerythraea]
MSHLVKDFRAALYSLSKRPGFVAVVILTLSLTLGAFITMSALNYTLLLKPLPYPEQEKLFIAQGERFYEGKQLASGIHSYAGTVELYKKNQVFSETAMLHYEEQLISNLPGQPKLYTTFTTPEIFSLSGAKMAQGRYFDSTEGLDTYKPVAVITYDIWQQKYAGAADILDKKVQISKVSYTIVGVLAENFIEPLLFMPGRETQIWLPFDYNYVDEEGRENGTNGSSNLKLAGKLKVGMRENEANQYLTNPMNDRFVEAARAFPGGKGVTVAITLRTFEDIIIGDSPTTSLMLFGGVFALLLIACANISNLFLSRAAEKQRQYAIQATLGAQKFHIFRSIFIELFILIFVSSVLALVFAHLSFALLQQYAEGHLARLNELSLNAPILFFTALVSLLLTSVFAAIISHLIDYKSLISILRSSGKGSGLQISRSTRQILIISQVALAGILLSVNFTLLKGSMEVINHPAGFNTENIIRIGLDASGQNFNREERIAYIETIKDKLLQMPEVNMVSNTIYPPLVVNSWTSSLAEDLSASGKQVLPNVNLVDEHYLTLFDIPLIAGRNFKPEEIRDSQKVIIINETVAKQFATSGGILGRNLYWEGGEDPYKVIGIIKDVNIPRVDMVPQMLAGRTTGFNFMIGLNDNHNVSKIQLNSIFRQINRNLRVSIYATVDESYKKLLLRDISIAVITIALSLLTLLLAGLGIYGVLSYSINLRTYELGVRMALGGSPNLISKLVLTDSAKPVAYGWAISIMILIALYMYLTQKMNYDISIEVSALVVTFILISLTSFIACFIPLRKIVRLQPINALK